MCMPTFFDLYSLYTEDFRLSSLFAMRQNWHTTRTFEMRLPRRNHGLVLFVGCDGVLKSAEEEKRIYAPRGSLVLLPEGSRYRWSFSNTEEGKSSTLLLEFDLISSDGKRMVIGGGPALLSKEHTEGARAHVEACIDALSRPLPVPALAYASAYALLASLTESGRLSHTVSGRFSVIKEGIRYLQEDPTQDKSIGEIAELCHVSINYFERLFKEYAGTSPAEYRLERRIERAKQLLSRNDGTSLAQIASELGYADVAYFCRVFKQSVGVTPGTYRKER